MIENRKKKHAPKMTRGLCKSLGKVWYWVHVQEYAKKAKSKKSKKKTQVLGKELNQYLEKDPTSTRELRHFPFSLLII